MKLKMNESESYKLMNCSIVFKFKWQTPAVRESMCVSIAHMNYREERIRENELKFWLAQQVNMVARALEFDQPWWYLMLSVGFSTTAG